MSLDYKAWWLDHAEHFECEDPVYFCADSEAWWYWNEAFTQVYGPFYTREEAEESCVDLFQNG